MKKKIELIEQTFEINIDNKTAVFSYPTSLIINAAGEYLSPNKKNEMKFAEVILENCFVSGDRTILTDDDYFLNVSGVIIEEVFKDIPKCILKANDENSDKYKQLVEQYKKVLTVEINDTLIYLRKLNRNEIGLLQSLIQKNPIDAVEFVIQNTLISGNIDNGYKTLIGLIPVIEFLFTKYNVELKKK